MNNIAQLFSPCQQIRLRLPVMGLPPVFVFILIPNPVAYTDSLLMPKRPKGFPRLRTSNNRLQLEWRYQGEAERLSLGLDDTPKNRDKAEDIALMIWNDLQLDRFVTGDNKKYLPLFLQKNTGIKHNSVIRTFNDMWVNYVKFGTDHLSESVLAIKIPTITKFFSCQPKISIDSADELVLRLSKGVSPVTAKTKIRMVRTACRWSVLNKYISADPFENYSSVKTKEKKNKGGDPFDQWEIDTIIEAYKTSRGEEWTLVIKFLLLTGCRPSEAFALRLEDVNYRTKKITFDKRRMLLRGKPTEMAGLKTQQYRIFPLGSGLEDICNQLEAISKNCGSQYLLTVESRPLDSGRLGRNWYGHKVKGMWDSMGTVSHLAESGKIDHYRSPYALRDTFISHCIAQGIPVITIAQWCGNSALVIERHYAGLLSSTLPPTDLMLR